MRSVIAIIAALLILGLGRTIAPALAEPAAAEYRLQAAFLLNFARFAQWPEATFPSNDSPIVIGVLGRDPFGDALAALQGQVVDGHPVQVRRFPDTDRLDHCQLLYVSDSETPQLENHLKTLNTRPILLVSDIPRFIERGGHIQLFTRQNKMRFRVNLQALGASDLTLSSKLLRLADEVVAP